jgi:hypothetical protein
VDDKEKALVKEVSRRAPGGKVEDELRTMAGGPLPLPSQVKRFPSRITKAQHRGSEEKQDYRDFH